MDKYQKATITGKGINVDTGAEMDLDSMMELYGADSGYRAFMAGMGNNVTKNHPIANVIKSKEHFKDIVEVLGRVWEADEQD